MKKNFDTKHVVMDTDMFMQLFASADLNTAIATKLVKHARKFNPHIREYFDHMRNKEQTLIKVRRKAVIDLQDRHGKIVYLRTMHQIGANAFYSYQPMLLVGKDHQNKTCLRLRPMDRKDIKSYSVDVIHRSVPTGYSYCRSEPHANTFIPFIDAMYGRMTVGEYLKQWAEHIR